MNLKSGYVEGENSKWKVKQSENYPEKDSVFNSGSFKLICR